MKALGMCAQCSGFLPAISVKCPHCGHVAPLRALGSAAAALATMGAFSSTLMACYGPACADSAGDCYGTYDGGRTVADAAVQRDSGADAEAEDAATDAKNGDAANDADAPDAP